MKPAGPLHPLAIPDGHFRSVAMDFIRPLPVDNSFDCILILADCLGADIQIIPCQTDMRAEEIAGLFFDHWYCENGCPNEIISDWDKIFISKFWVSVMHLSGIKHKISMAYHPQTDGLSKRTNKTIIQCIHFHIDQQQKGWSKVLQKICFDIINSVDASTDYAPFMLKSGHQPRLIPPIICIPEQILIANNELTETTGSACPPPPILDLSPPALSFIEELQNCLDDASDFLLAAKLSQVLQVNTSQNPDLNFKVGNKVLLLT